MQKDRYLATFAPGFEGVIGDLLDRHLAGVSDLSVSSGMALFGYAGPLDDVAELAFFNNVFLVFREWNTSVSPFHDLVKSSAGKSGLSARAADIAARAGGSFRVRFSKENQFTSVDAKVMAFAEQHISRLTGLKSDRFSPGIEFWYIIRREGLSFFAVRLTKKTSTEKYLEQGELRPEIVQLVTGLARITEKDRVLLDPFAGHGSIPEQLSIIHETAIIHASDIDPALCASLSRRFSGNNRVRVHHGDALRLEWIADASVDVIVTDPPWGSWKSESFREENSIDNLYSRMLVEFDRVLSDRGRAFVISGAKKEMLDAVVSSSAFAHCAAAENFRTDILVNGKKCAVFSLARKGKADEQA